ncbi:MAG: hypothetical protein HY704_08925 [Gemmatimonadetes bacterium]|nr:hypothetical protein [Gemmatimonadota bacterium]
MFTVGPLAQTEPSGWQGILARIPHDAAAIFVYVLAAVSIYLIWRGSRTQKGK